MGQIYTIPLSKIVEDFNKPCFLMTEDEKVKVLNLEGCMFDLRTMLEYYDSLFIDFEKENSYPK